MFEMIILFLGFINILIGYLIKRTSHSMHDYEILLPVCDDSFLML